MKNTFLPGRVGLLALACMAAATPMGSAETPEAVVTAQVTPQDEARGCRTLWAGQFTDVGKVCLTSDGTTLFIDYTLEDTTGLSFNEIHTWVGTTPQYPKYPKSPAPGQFAKPPNGNNSGRLAAGTRTYRVTFPLSNFGRLACGDMVYFLAHAAISNGESVWAEGDPAPGANWAMIGMTPIYCAEEEPVPPVPEEPVPPVPEEPVPPVPEEPVPPVPEEPVPPVPEEPVPPVPEEPIPEEPIPEEPIPEEPIPEEPIPEEPIPEEPVEPIPEEPIPEEPVAPEGCDFMTNHDDMQFDQNRLACGCYVQAGLCSCGGRIPADLGKGCIYDPQSCEILCKEEDRFSCDDTVWVSSSSGTSTTLYARSASTFNAAILNTTDQFGYDAMGFNHLDGFLYAISNNTIGSTGPRLIRIDRFGNVTDRGTFPALAGEEWIAGTVLKDGTFLIGSFASVYVDGRPFKWAMIKLGDTPSVIASGTMALKTGFDTGPFTWAAHPTNGLVYGQQPVGAAQTADLSTFLPDTAKGTLTMVSTRKITSSTTETIDYGQGCSAAFDKDGRLLFHCKQKGNTAQDEMFSIDVSSAVSTFLAYVFPLANGDIASCPFGEAP